MKAEKKTFAPVSDELKTTAAAAAFVENVTLDDIPKEAMRIGTRCVLDGLGLYVAGSDEHSVRILSLGTAQAQDCDSDALPGQYRPYPRVYCGAKVKNHEDRHAGSEQGNVAFFSGDQGSSTSGGDKLRVTFSQLCKNC